MKKRIAVLAIAVFVVVFTGLLFIMQNNNPNLPTQPHTNSIPQNNTQQPVADPTKPTNNNLDDCLRRASDSEANQEIINAGLQACRDKFR